MEIIAGTTEFYLEKETAAAIGKFDGVHLGHRRLLEEILKQKENGLMACVFTFDPAPAAFFGKKNYKELSTKEQKRELFGRLGVDILIEFPLTKQTAAMEPEKFVLDVLAKRMRVAYLAAGEDVSFGEGGKGNAALLKSMEKECGFVFRTIPKVCIKGKEISSSYIRSLVEQGAMEEAEEFLGEPYSVSGKVVHGKALGRTFGMPTANLIPDSCKLMPPSGVYFGYTVFDGKKYRSISNIGYKPTVSDERILGVETYLYDFEGSLYEEEIQVSFCHFHRPEKKFDSIDSLKKQLAKDISMGKTWNL